MDKYRVKQVLTEGIDKMLNRQFLLGITGEQREVLLSCRQLIISDESFAEKIASGVGPFREESDANVWQDDNLSDN